MIFDNSNYCFLNHSHELITYFDVCNTGMHVFVTPSRVVARLGCHFHLILYCVGLVDYIFNVNIAVYIIML